jgi:hypothetical protein
MVDEQRAWPSPGILQCITRRWPEGGHMREIEREIDDSPFFVCSVRYTDESMEPYLLGDGWTK